MNRFPLKNASISPFLELFKDLSLVNGSSQGSWGISQRIHSTMKKGTQPTVKGETDTISNHRLPQYASVTFRPTSHQTEWPFCVFIRQASSAQHHVDSTKKNSVTVIQSLKHTLIRFVIPPHRQSRTYGRYSSGRPSNPSRRILSQDVESESWCESWVGIAFNRPFYLPIFVFYNGNVI